jgi:hypothetical protein
MTRYRAAIAVTAAAALGLVCGVGFLFGSSAAPTETEANIERRKSFTEARRQAAAAAFKKARDKGLATGRRAGRREAVTAAAKKGETAGTQDAKAKLAAIAQEEAEDAARAEAEERAENCGAPLFTPGYCPTDEEIEQENLAESLCGPGDPALEEEAAEQGIQCRP